jgi:heme O synthase-like polyprenyltransferase
VRPAFYSLAPGGWRDYVTLLHPPYTLWHLSYVAVGAALAPELAPDRLAWTLAAFALAMGVGAHALDELRGRPLQTRIADRVLWVLAGASLAGAATIGVLAAVWWTPWLLAFVAFGVFIVPAYNLELAGGRFHNTFWFAAAWGAFPALTGYVAAAETVRAEAVLAALYAALLSYAQRVLSTPVRELRRRVRAVSGELEYRDGTREPVTDATVIGAPEAALQILTGTAVVLAVALLVMRW